MQKTTNFNLNQWDAADPVRREDFNADNLAIDAALAGIPKIATGTYTGDGTETGMEITVGFAPKMVLVWCNYSASISSYTTNYCGMAIQGQTLKDNLTLTDTGFQVKSLSRSNGDQVYPNLNASRDYFYFAVG